VWKVELAVAKGKEQRDKRLFLWHSGLAQAGEKGGIDLGPDPRHPKYERLFRCVMLEWNSGPRSFRAASSSAAAALASPLRA